LDLKSRPLLSVYAGITCFSVCVSRTMTFREVYTLRCHPYRRPPYFHTTLKVFFLIINLLATSLMPKLCYYTRISLFPHPWTRAAS